MAKEYLHKNCYGFNEFHDEKQHKKGFKFFTLYSLQYFVAWFEGIGLRKEVSLVFKATKSVILLNSKVLLILTSMEFHV